MPKPLQKPMPPVSITLASPFSGLAKLAEHLLEGGRVQRGGECPQALRGRAVGHLKERLCRRETILVRIGELARAQCRRHAPLEDVCVHAVRAARGDAERGAHCRKLLRRDWLGLHHRRVERLLIEGDSGVLRHGAPLLNSEREEFLQPQHLVLVPFRRLVLSEDALSKENELGQKPLRVVRLRVLEVRAVTSRSESSLVSTACALRHALM